MTGVRLEGVQMETGVRSGVLRDTGVRVVVRRGDRCPVLGDEE